jgi:hypothetical protein
LASIFKQLFALERKNGTDLASLSPVELRGMILDEVAATPDSELAKLVGDEYGSSTALLAAVHAFIKKDARKAALAPMIGPPPIIRPWRAPEAARHEAR